MVLKFGTYELNTAAYELRRRGRPVRLERLAMELMLLLVERRGTLVTREEIAARLWDQNDFRDVDNGVHTAVRKVRQALKDSASHPAFVQTVPGKGYRFVAHVTVSDGDPPATAAGCASVAILPFENLTGDVNQDYWSDGLTEDVIAALGNLLPGRLAVIARTSVMRFKRTKKSAREIASELGVEYLLEGTLRRDDRSVRVTARLVRARDQTQVWSESYDRSGPAALQLQEELGRAIAEQVQAEFTLQPAAVNSRQTTFDPDAYDLYLRGRQYWNQIRPTALRRAIEFFESAVAKDPSFALAWSGLADTYSLLALTSDYDPAVVWPKARSAADEAVRLQSALAETCASSGIVAFWLDWDWRRAEQDLRRAVALNPSYVTAHRYLAHVLSNLGRHPEALGVMANARMLDPLSPVLHAVSGQLFYQAGQLEHAEDGALQALALNPELFLGHLVLGRVHERSNRPAAALVEFESAFQLSEGNTEALSLRGYTLAAMGRRREAEQVMQTLLGTAASRYVPPYNIAMLYLALGESGAAYEWLEKARLGRDVRVVFLTVEPRWDVLRDEQAFQSLLQRCGLPIIRKRVSNSPARPGASSARSRS